MSSEFDRLEEDVTADMRSTFPETVLDHAMNPRNAGNMREVDGYGSVTGPCGDTMQIWLRVRDDTIEDVSFWTDGCGATIATGSMVTELAKRKSMAQASRITQQDVLDALGGLPEENVHCALLAANALKAAIRDYVTFRNEPWKRVYGRR